MKNPIIVIAGPTACGKTATSIALAKEIGGEIISADSMQVYKFMDIGTAKITKEDMDGVKHYLIDEFYPDYDFSIAVFQKYTKKYIEEIYKKGKVPILVGGTGFYINSIIFDNEFNEHLKDEDYRKELENLAEINGKEFLHLKLKSLDFKAYEKIHPNNVKKVIRALEFYHQTGKKFSEHNDYEKRRKPIYEVSFFVLNMDRNLLYERINERVDNMFNMGLITEVNELIKKGYGRDLISMQGIGYKEVFQYLTGEVSLDRAVELVKKNTRNFAKRQITWFKHQCDGIWIDVADKCTSQIVDEMKTFIKPI